MDKEIKEILRYLEECVANDNRFLIGDTNATKLSYYITNLQEENQKLKEKLNCKEYFSATMPEDTEFVILTKNNYDRQQKDLALENIKLKETNEEHRKINGDLRKENQKLVKVIDEIKFVFDNPENYFSDGCDCREIEDILNKLTKLKGDSDE